MARNRLSLGFAVPHVIIIFVDHDVDDDGGSGDDDDIVAHFVKQHTRRVTQWAVFSLLSHVTACDRLCRAASCMCAPHCIHLLPPHHLTAMHCVTAPLTVASSKKKFNGHGAGEGGGGACAVQKPLQPVKLTTTAAVSGHRRLSQSHGDHFCARFKYDLANQLFNFSSMSPEISADM